MEYDLELWLETRATNGPDRNQVYDISMIMAQDVRFDCNVLSVGTPQFGVNKPLPVSKELVKQQIDAPRDEMEAKYEEKKTAMKGDDCVHVLSLSSLLRTSKRF